MATPQDRMQIPEYVRRELSEVYLLMDHIAGRPDRKLEQALAASTPEGTPINLKGVCSVAWPPTDQDRAATLALVLTAKDRLSHAASPATAYSIAFTYLSIIPPGSTPPKNLRQRVSTHLRRRLGRGSHSRGSLVPALPTTAGAQDATNDSEEPEEIDEVTTVSTMEQFARDAFPGLDARREWLVNTMIQLAVALVVLLFLTCFVSWDLAVGQRVLADYKWLSSHPDVMQIDPAQATSQCTEAQLGKVPPVKPTGGGASEDAKPSTDPSKIDPGSRCARFLAGLRVLPIMEQWITDQYVLTWLIHGSPLPSKGNEPCAIDPSQLEKRPTCQGYILEVQRVLVTTLNYNILPLVLGALAATAAALREITKKTAGHELEPRDLPLARLRILLGAFLGAVIGLLVSPGASTGLFELAEMSTGIQQTGDTVALSPAVYGFFAGFATGRIFNWLDDLLEKIFTPTISKL